MLKFMRLIIFSLLLPFSAAGAWTSLDTALGALILLPNLSWMFYPWALRVLTTGITEATTTGSCWVRRRYWMRLAYWMQFWIGTLENNNAIACLSFCLYFCNFRHAFAVELNDDVTKSAVHVTIVFLWSMKITFTAPIEVAKTNYV